MYCLQNRWKLENKRLRYYGLRNKSAMFKNVVKLTAKQAKIVSRLPCELTDREYKCVGKLVGVQIVEKNAKRVTPRSLDEARFCARCAANDFIIPGLEFDENGMCPMCQTVDETKNLKSVVPIKNVFPRSKKSRFDVAVFYTGGKDWRSLGKYRTYRKTPPKAYKTQSGACLTLSLLCAKYATPILKKYTRIYIK